MKKKEYTDQDLSFRLAEELETWVDICFKGNDELILAYEIESVIRSCLEDVGLRLRVSDPLKFESNKSQLL